MDWYRLLRREERYLIAGGARPEEARSLAAVLLGYAPNPHAPGMPVFAGSDMPKREGLSGDVHAMLARWRKEAEQ